jgi:hypothetical protein
MTGVGPERSCSGGATVDRGGGGGCKLGGGVPVTGGSGVDDKCLESFVRLMWCCCSTWQGLGDGGVVGRRRGRAAAAEERRRARGQASPVGEMENGRCCELQEGDVVLMGVWIEGGMLWRRLPTARPNGGEAWTAAMRGRRRPGVM